MYKTITESAFVDAFMQSKERNGTFTYNALVALFNHIENNEDGGDKSEFDMIALCCEWTEYASFHSAYVDIMGERPDAEDKTEEEENAKEYLEANTTTIEFDGGILFLKF